MSFPRKRESRGVEGAIEFGGHRQMMSKGFRKRAIGGLALLVLATSLVLGVWALKASRPSAQPAESAKVSPTIMETAQGTESTLPAPSQGGADVGRIQESVDYILRDASGKIKARQTTAGK